MQGKSEFEVTGNLKDWERWDRLHEIKVKALTIGATHDEMDPADMRRMATLMPNATSAICPNGSHLDMWDDQAVYFQHCSRSCEASSLGSVWASTEGRPTDVLGSFHSGAALGNASRQSRASCHKHTVLVWLQINAILHYQHSTRAACRRASLEDFENNHPLD